MGAGLIFLSVIIVNKHNKEIKNANRTVIWSSGNVFIFGAGGLRFKSRAG